MPGMLAKSRSLRILRGGRRDAHKQDYAVSAPPAYPQADIDRSKATTPVTRTDLPVEAPAMLQRPRTSGGPADHGRLFHKKTFLAADHDPQSSFSSSSKSTTTLIYTSEFRESREGFIGIALGSPTMAPDWMATQSADFVPYNHRTVTQITSNLPSLPAKQEEVQKPKLSRWKSLFGRRPQPSPESKPSFYQLAQSAVAARADSHHDGESPKSQTTPRYEEPKEMESPPAFKPEIRGSRRLPKDPEPPVITPPRPRALTGTMASNRNTALLELTSNAATRASVVNNDSPTVRQTIFRTQTRQDSSLEANLSTRSTVDKPLLDVDIPTIKMERYSVMFGNVLQTGLESTSNRSSSLLVRRQGNTDRLRPLNALSTKQNEDGTHLGIVKPQRRATSPTFAPKSPPITLSLFPAPGNGAPSPRLSPPNRTVQRSKTLPTPSPRRQIFSSQVTSNQGINKALEKPKPEDAKLLAVPQGTNATKELVDLSQNSQLLSPSTASTASFTSGSDEMSSVGSPASATAWRPQMDEPEWEIVSKPKRRPSHRELKEALSSHPTNVATELPQHQPPPSTPLEQSSTTAINSKPSTPQIVTTPVPQSGDRLEASPRPRAQGPPQERKRASGLTIGVARSVSVSRASPRSADMLKPGMVRRGTEGSEMLLDSRALTPTLVELKDRRSQRVQLVEV